ncbi:MAG: hypothetical protein EZS28_045494 [Streblomastix strix]|uniref:Myotubularin phosphatase domain-containing protein n=1 Tax=Streblomastix strix TaxID=222440 RepID=A0A5J4TLY2_9EUKA|nr:MAG: hypothetical protein EZS28_045494 [Streblomastix strix]
MASTALQESKWFNLIRVILNAAVLVYDYIVNQNRSVLLHCTDGWDRTPTISSLSSLLLDPYYRTLQGFESFVHDVRSQEDE